MPAAGMIPAAQELLPGAPIWYLGLYRDEETLRPVRYYDKLQGYPPVDIALILDPMLATGGSAGLAAGRLKEKGVRKVSFVGLIAAPQGLEYLHREHPDVEVYVAAVDEGLNEHAYIEATLVGPRPSVRAAGGVLQPQRLGMDGSQADKLIN